MTVVLHIRDSRRLTGPSRFWDKPSAILEVGAPDPADTDSEVSHFVCQAEQLIDRWQHWADNTLRAVGWADQQTTIRVFGDGISLLLSAPVDALYAATEVNEFAFDAALADLLGGSIPAFEENVARLKDVIAKEANPRLLDLERFAKNNGLLFLSDDDQASIGSGGGASTWPINSLPRPEDLSAGDFRNIKVAAVSGTNGKSTTVRLLSSMISAPRSVGQLAVPGVTSTDWIRVGKETLCTGDYSGPGGARTVLRNRRVDVAVLEAARGGLNRRGLGLPRLDVATLTNIGSDHLGDHGSATAADLLDTKWTIARVSEHVVLNARDPLLRERGLQHFVPGSKHLTWFSMDPNDSAIAEHNNAGGRAVVLRGRELIAMRGQHHEVLAEIDDVPCTMGGAAAHNLDNALAAIATARALGVSSSNIEYGLRTFGLDPADNPGRLTQFTFGRNPDAPHESVRVIVDFAHNPEGLETLLAVAENLAPLRWSVSLGQAGDRDDAAISGLADVAWRYQPDRIQIKELDEHRRGRALGEVPRLITQRLVELGAPPKSLEQTNNEMHTAAVALRWARAGDLVLLTVHDDRQRVLDRLGKLQAENWQPGSDLPAWWNSL